VVSLDELLVTRKDRFTVSVIAKVKEGLVDPSTGYHHDARTIDIADSSGGTGLPHGFADDLASPPDEALPVWQVLAVRVQPSINDVHP
jgi:hypothetical protein